LVGKTPLWLALCVVIGAQCLTKGAGAQVPDPHLVFRTLRTAHFEITYHEPLGAMAQRLAVLAERANSLVGRALGFLPSQMTRILLTDDTDDANGVAGVIPHNEIHLYAAAPDDLSSIGDYDDWVATLVTHEYTHILHLDQIGGISTVINAILGKTLAPNTMQPQWFIEGIAVYEESAQTSGGRMRSSLFDMLMRMDTLDDKLLSLAQISNNPVRWPHGDIRYLYGSQFVGFIGRHFGDAALHRIGHDYGKQTLPYGMNRIAMRATGFTYVDLYEQFRAELKQHYMAQRDAVVAAGLTADPAIAAHADVTRTPRFLRDGRLAYWTDDGRSTPRIRLLDGSLLTRTTSDAVFAAEPNGRGVIYSQVAPYRDIYYFHDLFRLDLASGDSERLTTGMRASQPDVSPNGRQVAFVTQRSGTSNLEVAELEDIPGTRRVLLRSRPYDQVFTPRFSPDGSRIAVSAWRKGGYRDILLVDPQSGAIRELTHDRAIDTGPTWSPDGQRVYFSSDRSGIANIYAYELSSGLLYQVTNVLGGAYQPVLSPDGRRLIYVDYQSTGYGLCEHALGQDRPAPSYADQRPRAESTPDQPPLPVEPYNPLPSLLPYNYRLSIAPGAYGEEISVDVSGSDIAYFHNYSLHVGVAFENPSKPEAAVYYRYNRTPLQPSVQLYRRLSTRGGLEVGGQSRTWIADTLGGGLGVSYMFPSVLRSQSLDFSYALAYVGKAEAFGGKLDPNEPPPRLPELGYLPSAGFGYRYSDVTAQAYDISPSGGRSLTFHIDVTDPIMGRDIHSVSTRWELRQFARVPWFAGHVFALRYAGGLAAGDRGRAGSFSVGGFPQNVALPSLYDLVAFGSIPSLDGNALRGYPANYRWGPQFQMLQLEYRLPIFDPEWGIYTLPFYIRRLAATVFVDAGNAYAGAPKLSEFLVGTGAELFAQLVLGYTMIVSVRMGLAHGLTHGGETQFYLHVGTAF
jgi:hypothetical protein